MDNPALDAAAIYIGLSIGILTWLSVGIGRLRGQLKISIGDGGEPRMIRAMRGQANFVENVPLTLLALLGMALMGAPAWAIHVLGLTLCVARVIHGMHFLAADAPGWQRAAGTLLTLLVQAVAGLGLIAHALL
ncbi:MAPEG family protein [Oceanibium sediminis]|uniref:MAPEG family protein n=1 Tax=Oceanibium sediminis TaxID=2026339 RepID=UPI000DD48616|nr:MAPEG family protein [Oceanibium sediminis]